ncbi:C40 family peptidase [Micromonospora sp.]|uniref:C40 family peptidase n=1 Tax=Micromonospora sp. TaxID=1876 RepID=UPI003B3AE4FD
MTTADEQQSRSSAGTAAKNTGKAVGKQAAKKVATKVLGKKLLIALGIKGFIFLAVILLVVILAAVLGNDDANAGDTSCGQVTPANLGGSASSLTAEQNANAKAIIGVAISLGLGERGALIGVTVGLTESTLRNVDYGDMMGPGGSMSSSRGLFQQLDAWGPLADRMDPVKAATMFYTGGQAGQRGLTDIPGWQQMPVPQAAQAVQQSEFADGSNFARQLELAQVITTAILAANPTAGTSAGSAAPATSAGTSTPGCTTGGLTNTVTPNGTSIAIPANEYVTEALRGHVLQAPTEKVAKGLGAGFGALGLPYVWGGGTDGGGPNDGCSRGGGELNSCQGLVGFDCSGLTAYVLVQGGYPSPGGNSSAQRDRAHAVPWDQGQVGDIVGFPGHVAIYLGVINGTRYILEASTPGVPVHVVPLTRDDYDDVLYRYWT